MLAAVSKVISLMPADDDFQHLDPLGSGLAGPSPHTSVFLYCSHRRDSMRSVARKRGGHVSAVHREGS